VLFIAFFLFLKANKYEALASMLKLCIGNYHPYGLGINTLSKKGSSTNRFCE